MENLGQVNLRRRRSSQIHLTQPRLTFLYLEFLWGVPVKKNTLYNNSKQTFQSFAKNMVLVRNLRELCFRPHILGWNGVGINHFTQRSPKYPSYVCHFCVRIFCSNISSFCSFRLKETFAGCCLSYSTTARVRSTF